MNICGLYLKVLTLSDITLADGKTLIKYQLKGKQSSLFELTLTCPKQEKPDRRNGETFKE